MAELWQQAANDLADTFRSGDASATEIVSAHLRRIDAVNGDVNAVVRRIDERALASAGEIDDARDAGTPLGPLAGVPFTIKDNIDLAGDPTTQGVPALADFVPTTNSPVVERMIEAGAIPLARTNMPDLGLRIVSESSLHGVTRNPWAPERTVGGSSGGEAAALATGMTPLGLGNDLGGSLRNPATCCSIASLKPTLGVIPHALEGMMGDESAVLQVLAAEGPMARTVPDVRLELSVLAGAHPRDPWSVPATLSEPSTPLRVALIPNPPGGQTDPRIAAATEQAGAWLRDAGHLVETTVPDVYEKTVDCWKTLVIGDIAVGMDEIRAVAGTDAIAFLEETVDTASVGVSLDDMYAAWIERSHLISSWNEFFRDFDAVLTPTWTQLPFHHGADASPGNAAATIDLARPSLVGNVLGCPAAAVPATLIDGVPVGMLVTGPAWSDLTCLALAADIEARNDVPLTPIDPRGEANG